MPNNPYNPPKSSVTQSSGATYQPKLFDTSGRIGRLRYLAYSFIIFPILLLFTGLMALTGSFSNGYEGTSVLLFGVFLITMIVIGLIYAKRRFNDLGHSGWFALTTLIPYVNMLVQLYLICAKGNAEENQFGLPPTKNSFAVKLVACFFILIPILGIIAAITIPAYQDYAIRASQ